MHDQEEIESDRFYEKLNHTEKETEEFNYRIELRSEQIDEMEKRIAQIDKKTEGYYPRT